MAWNDRQITAAALKGMISPFIPQLVRKAGAGSVISFGLSSFGYDMRIGDTFQVLERKHVYPAEKKGYTGPTILDPKAFDGSVMREVKTHELIIPAHGFALGYSVERFQMPANVIGVCLGKSTYARLGLVVGITPLEPGWTGHVTIELSNTTDLPCKVYAYEGIAQVLFIEGDEPETNYEDRGGKYQDQPANIVWAKV